MTDKSNDLEKRNCIKNLLIFLDKNKEFIKNYRDHQNFQKYINNLYHNLKIDNFDSMEFDIPESVNIKENNTYFYYSKSIGEGNQNISIINKNLNEYYFININSYVNCEIIKYYKIYDSEIIVIKNNRKFESVEDVNNYKSLILKPIIDNYF